MGHSKYQMGLVSGIVLTLLAGAFIALMSPKEALEMCEGAVREIAGGRK